MSEIINIIVWAGFIYILFIFLRGMNENQVEKHKKNLEDAQKKNDNQIENEE